VPGDVALTHAGGFRPDLPEGGLHRGHVLDTSPFVHTLATPTGRPWPTQQLAMAPHG
jgi:hypothetical protein